MSVRIQCAPYAHEMRTKLTFAMNLLNNCIIHSSTNKTLDHKYHWYQLKTVDSEYYSRNRTISKEKHQKIV